MLIRGSWRDAIRFETPGDGGAGTGSGNEPEDPIAKLTPEELRAALLKTQSDLKAANAESASRRRELERIEREETERKNKELSEVEKAQKRAQDAEAANQALQDRYRNNAIRSAVRVAAIAAGFVDAEDVIKLADLSGVELGEDDQVKGAEEAVKALAKAKPHLLAATKPTPPNINSGAGGNPVPLTPEQLAAQKRPTDSMYQPF